MNKQNAFFTNFNCKSTTKAQLNESVLLYALVVIILVGLLAFGTSSIFKLIKQDCETGILKMQKEITGSVEVLSGKPGNTDALITKSVCNTKRMFFIDSNNALPEMFTDYPEISNSVGTGGKNNVFLYGNDGFVGSFYAGRIASQYPTYYCVNGNDNTFSMNLIGMVLGVGFEPTGKTQSCNPTIANEPDNSQLDNIASQLNLKSDYYTQLYQNSKYQIEGVGCQITNDSKNLNIIIGYKQELTNLSIYHFIPQCLQDNFNNGFTLNSDLVVYPLSLNADKTKSGEQNLVITFFINSTGNSNGAIVINYGFDETIPDSCTNYCNIAVINREVCSSNNDCIWGRVCAEDGKCH